MIDWSAMLPAPDDIAGPPAAVPPEAPPPVEPLPGIASAARAGCDLRYCRECANLAKNGRCLAAARRELVASPSYTPETARLRRCEAFAPLPDDPDQRRGRDRWPGL